MMMGLIGLTKRQTKDASDKMKDEDERRIKSDKILNTSFQGWQMKDEDEGILHLDEELSLSSTFIQDERIN